MKHIKTWRERVNEGDSIFAKATALEAEVAELRAYIGTLADVPIDNGIATPYPMSVTFNSAAELIAFVERYRR